jgi:signal transduction histidine kinase
MNNELNHISLHRKILGPALTLLAVLFVRQSSSFAMVYSLLPLYRVMVGLAGYLGGAQASVGSALLVIAATVRFDSPLLGTFLTVVSSLGLAAIVGELRIKLLHSAIDADRHARLAAAELKGVSDSLATEHSQLQSLFGETPAILNVLHGPEHVFELVHPKTRLLLGGKDVSGLPIRKALPGFAEHPLIRLLDEVYRTGKPYFGTELPLRFKTVEGNFKDAFFNFSFQPWHDHKGDIAGIMTFGVDVTEQVLARRRVEEALRARDEFITIASHELKTPLTSLKLQTSLTRKRLDRHGAPGSSELFSSEQLRKLIDTEDRQVDRLSRLVDEMLEITRINTGKLAIHHENVDLAALTREVLERFSPHQGSTLPVITFQTDQRVTGHWDRYRMEQVIINLISNAIKYGGGKPIRISASVLEGRARLVVEDQGIGIDRKDHERIFQRFERAISSSEVSGFGLGLYISQQIVEAHGGSIRVESELGGGAKFIVELPIAAAKAHAA